MASLPRVLTIAGSDSGGGAGIQADIKTIMALGGYAASAITALTAQNTLGIQAILPVPPDFIRAQIGAVVDDIGADCIKVGMLISAASVDAVAESLEDKATRVPLVIDPIIAASDGTEFLDHNSVDRLKTRLFPLGTLLTPNVPEAERLLETRIANLDDMLAAARGLLEFGAPNVLLKGGHLAGDWIYDVLVEAETTTIFSHAKVRTLHTHGTGCTLSAAISAGIAQGMSVRAAVLRARTYLLTALQTAHTVGRGRGPVHHSLLEPAGAGAGGGD